MWQRIQTVFLVIVIISLIGAILFPLWMLQQGEVTHRLYALHYMTSESGNKTHQYMPYAITAILFVAAITVAFIQIGKYKDRLTQIKLGSFNSLLLVGGYGAAVYFGSTFARDLGGTYGFGIWLPALAVFNNWLALRFIRRDEKTVRDANRLR
jgi:hypothetical protein